VKKSRNKLILGIICVAIIMIASISKMVNLNETNQYIVITEDGKKHNVDTYNITSTEAKRLLNSGKALIVEKDGIVYGSSNSSKTTIQKIKHNKTVEKRSFKESDKEWNMQTIKATTITNVSTNKVKVALIDSGIDYTEDINVYMRKNFIPGEDNVSVVYEDSCGHGTSVAGIIAAKDNDDGITGINPNVELYSARVLDENNSAPISRVIEAIYWAIDNNVNILNISFGTSTNSEALHIAIQDAYNAGILIIAAAGNNGNIEYPAAYDEVIAVGSVDSKGDHSDFSATGEKLELVAPGEDIVSTGDFGGVSVSCGTSMAAPHVVGVASVLWQKDLSCNSDFIRKLLDFSANEYGDSIEYGYGLIDLENALNQYDKFKGVYANTSSTLQSAIDESVENNILLNNTNNIIVFDNVDYVEGSWATTRHQFYAGLGTLSPGALEVVKLGAEANDIYTTLKDMGPHPQWHGYGFLCTYNGVNYYPNYMANYILITNIALGYPKTDTNSNTFTMPSKPSYMSSYDYDSINGVATATTIAGTQWSVALGSNSLTDRNKRLFMYGMALHTVTDVFAHQAYVTSSGAYIDHCAPNHPDADSYSSSDYPNRDACAQAMAKLVIGHILGYTPGNLSDFYNIIEDYTYNASFKMTNYSEKANLIDSNTYTTHQRAFDSMTNGTVY